MAETDVLVGTPETGRSSFFESKIRPVLAEFVGSCILVFVVCSMSVINFSLGVGLVYGFAMVFLTESLGNISGGFFNPAITLGLVITGTIGVRLAVGYFVAQVLGGMLGAALVRAVLPETIYRSPTFVGGCTVLNESNGAEPGWGVFSEAILTFILVLTVLTTVANEKHCQLAPLCIGFSVVVTSSAGYQRFATFILLLDINMFMAYAPILPPVSFWQHSKPYRSWGTWRQQYSPSKWLSVKIASPLRSFLTGGSMNPARSFGPAVAFSVYDDGVVWKYHYIYWVGPLAGTLVACLLFKLVFAAESKRIQIRRATSQ